MDGKGGRLWLLGAGLIAMALLGAGACFAARRFASRPTRPPQGVDLLRSFHDKLADGKVVRVVSHRPDGLG